jgi:hypothetical protein
MLPHKSVHRKHGYLPMVKQEIKLTMLW